MADNTPPFADLLAALMQDLDPRRALAQVAAGTGLSKQTISLLLNGGTTNPSLETIRKLASFFSVDPSYFFTGKLEVPQVARRAVARQNTASPELLRRMDDFARQLDELQKSFQEIKADADQRTDSET